MHATKDLPRVFGTSAALSMVKSLSKAWQLRLVDTYQRATVGRCSTSTFLEGPQIRLVRSASGKHASCVLADRKGLTLHCCYRANTANWQQ